MNFSFNKTEHLKSRKAFEDLFKTGSVEFIFPFKIVWQFAHFPDNSPMQVAFSVPKKRFKQANKRNTIRRRVHEAYRLNKLPLYTLLNEQKQQIQLLFIYIAPDILGYHEIEPRIKIALNAIMAALKKRS